MVTRQIIENDRAPCLDDWFVVEIDQHRHLVGYVFGHPSVRWGARTITSPLHIIADDESWAQTASRLYYLGQQRTTPLTEEWKAAIASFARNQWGTSAVKFPALPLIEA
jgi:hypothetical protein